MVANKRVEQIFFLPFSYMYEVVLYIGIPTVLEFYDTEVIEKFEDIIDKQCRSDYIFPAELNE